jgi:hypothetical protein
MITRTTVWVWLVVGTARGWLARQVDAARADERGSPTLETVIIAAGLLALAVGLVAVIKIAVNHYAASIH